jgi:uncharacterized protein
MSGLDRPFSVDLRGLGDGRHRLTLVEPGELLDLPEVLSTGSDISLELTISVTGSLITASGRVAAHLVMDCARCLEPFTREIENEFDLVIRRRTDGLLLEDEDDVSASIGDKWIAFDAPAREALILSVPMKPLCSDECQGLCPVCGVNLNESTCECAREPTDARWDGLKTLLDEM